MQSLSDRVSSVLAASLDASRAGLARARASSREVTCAEVAGVLPSILDGGSSAGEAVVDHVGQCLRCQAELARYRKLLRLLNQMRAARVEPPPGAVSDVLGAIEDAAQRQVIRSAFERAAARLRRGTRASSGSDRGGHRRPPGPPTGRRACGAIVIPTRGDRCSVNDGPRPRSGGQ